jgi:hypothetical protein
MNGKVIDWALNMSYYRPFKLWPLSLWPWSWRLGSRCCAWHVILLCRHGEHLCQVISKSFDGWKSYGQDPKYTPIRQWDLHHEFSVLGVAHDTSSYYGGCLCQVTSKSLDEWLSNEPDTKCDPWTDSRQKDRPTQYFYIAHF